MRPELFTNQVKEEKALRFHIYIAVIGGSRVISHQPVNNKTSLLLDGSV